MCALLNYQWHHKTAYLDIDIMFRCLYQVNVCSVNGSFNVLDSSRPITRTTQNLPKI